MWDTTIAKMTTPQIVFVAGHEMGHYVLNHIWKGLAFGAVGLFILFYLGFRTIGSVLARRGEKWQIRGVDDWASLAGAVASDLRLSHSSARRLEAPSAATWSIRPISMASRSHTGLTPDSSQVAAQSFQILGEVDLSDPDPNPVDVFLFYSHPPIPDRVRFALTYDPWDHGEQPEFVK